MTMDRFSGVNAGYVLELYGKYRQDPQSVDAVTRAWFESWVPVDAIGRPAPAAAAALSDLHIIVGAANLAESIRRFGHLAATLDPLGSAQIGDSTLLAKTHGITDDDLKLVSILLVDVWMWTPFMMLISLAGLNAIPKHIYEAMQTGPQNMPSFPDTTLSEENKKDIIAYLDAVNGDETVEPGGLSLGGLGPVSEGLFGWVFGLGALIAVAVWVAARTAKAKKS